MNLSLFRLGPSALGILSPWRDQPLFWLGLTLRILACCLLVPHVQEHLFVPFMRETLLSPTLDPWGKYIESGGPDNAFPYGPVMYLAHTPTLLLGIGLDLLTSSNYFAQVGFSISLLVADFTILSILLRLFEQQRRELLLFYWLSPITLYVTYYHGQTDVIPTAILLVSLLLLKKKKLVAAGTVIGASICAKISMVIALPFLLLYAWNNHQVRQWRTGFAIAAAVTVFLGQGSFFLLSDGVRTMLLSPEIRRIYQMALPLGDGQFVYLMILTYIFAVYSVYVLRRVNFDLLYAAMGVGFMIVLTMSPAATGWYVWSVPFLVAYQLTGEDQQRPRVVVLGFSVLFVGISLLSATGARLPLLSQDWSNLHLDVENLSKHHKSILLTLQTSAGLIIAMSMYRRGVSRNDFFRLSRRPIAVGIAGDSGSGKDTLSSALAALFSEGSVVAVSGDDYHRYERNSPMWKNLTHVDPRANDLRAFNHDVLSLIDGRSISCRRYDHSTGRFTPRRRVRGNNVILVSGLHALFSHEVRRELDVAVFLDMDERLRRYFKIKRDTAERGQSADRVETIMERRRPLATKYVAPQAKHADVVMQLTPSDPSSLSYDSSSPGPLKLKTAWRDATQYQEFSRILIGLCGVGIDHDSPDEDGVTRFELAPEEVEAEDIELAARCLAPELDDLLANKPRWMPGVLGVMQLILLLQLVRSINLRK